MVEIRISHRLGPCSFSDMDAFLTVFSPSTAADSTTWVKVASVLWSIWLQRNGVFCLEHRSYGRHSCPNADQNDVTVVICPLCAKGVRLIPSEDANITWERHVSTDCDPSNYERATKKRKCPAKGCRETLVFSNTIRCKDCAMEYCLKHRFGPDHNCPGPRKQEIRLLGRWREPPKGQTAATQSQNASTWWASVRASAEASLSRLGISSQAQNSKGYAHSSSRHPLVEQCVQCPAKFSTVSALIEHVESVHGARNRANLKGKVTIDACPKCSKGFTDPVKLVEHVENVHGGNSSYNRR